MSPPIALIAAHASPAIALALLKGAAIFGLVLLIDACRPRARASDRHLLLLLAFAAQLLLFAAPLLPDSMFVSFDPRIAFVGGATPAALPATSTPPSVSIGLLDAVAPIGAHVLGQPLSRPARGFMLIWGAGVILLLARRFAGVLALRAARRYMHPSQRMREIVAPLVHRFEITHRTSMFLCPGAAPVAFGIWRPSVLLPQAALEWPRERLNAVCLHELAHLERRDPLTKLLSDIVLALCWLDPFAWIAHYRVAELRERACDDAVLAAGVRASDYVLHLIEVAKLNLTVRLPRSAVSALARSSAFSRRMEGALSVHGPDVAGSRAGRALLLGAVTGTGLALSVVVPQAPRNQRDAVGESAFATGCDWSGGRHLNRTRPNSIEGRVWDVQWDGDDCAVAFQVVGDGTRRVPTVLRSGALTSAAYAVLRVRSVSGTLTLSATATEAPAWLRAFRQELDRHTAFDLPNRFPILLTQGIDTLFAEVDRMQGDHAAGEYLYQLVLRAPLSKRQLREVLDLSDRRVFNDFERHRLLVAVADRYDVLALGLAPRFHQSAARLVNSGLRRSMRRSRG